MANWYVSSVAHAAVAQWAALTVYGAGSIVRQLAAPTVGEERCFRTALGGTSGASEPTWTVTKGASQAADGSVADWLEVTGNESYQTSGGAWNAPAARCATMLNWGADDDTVYVRSDHDETQASALTLRFKNSNAAIQKLISVKSACAIPPGNGDYEAGAQISTTGNSAISNAKANVCSNYEIWGVTFNVGDGANGPNFIWGNGNDPQSGRFVDCLIHLRATGNHAIQLGPSALSSMNGQIELINTPVKFSAVGQSMQVRHIRNFIWRDTPNAIQGSVPTTLFPGTSAGFVPRSIERVDLSALTSGKTIWDTVGLWRFVDCKLGASVTRLVAPAISTVMGSSQRVEFLRCNSGDVEYSHQATDFFGEQTVETGIVRSGGASDGTTPIAWKIVTTSAARWSWPFISLPIVIPWSGNVGSTPVTATVYGVWGGGAVPNNDDIWIELSHLGTSGTPLGVLVTSTKANTLASNAALASDASSWGGSTTPFKMTVTFTPQEKGAFMVLVKAAKASATFYIDPRVVLS